MHSYIKPVCNNKYAEHTSPFRLYVVWGKTCCGISVSYRFSTGLWASHNDSDSISVEWSFRTVEPRLTTRPVSALTQVISPADWGWLFCSWRLEGFTRHLFPSQYLHRSSSSPYALCFFSVVISPSVSPSPPLSYLCFGNLWCPRLTKYMAVIILNHWKQKILKLIFVSHKTKL